MNLLKRLTYQAELIRVVHLLRLRRILSKAYYQLTRPPGGIVRVKVRGLCFDFYVRAHWQLRLLESTEANGKMQQDLEALMSALQPGDVVYDVGANIGFSTIILAKVVGPNGQVIAFEPQSPAYGHLQDNLKLNDLMNVRTFQKALGDDPSQRTLYLNEDSVLSSLVRPCTGEKGHELVEVAEGDRLRAAENLPVPRAVKIDVEGYEYDVIRGLRHTLAEPACKLLCCEIHPPLLMPRGVKSEAVLDLIKSLGFGRIALYSFGTWTIAVCHKV